MLYIFPTKPDEVEKYVQSNSSENCIHRYNVEIMNIFYPEMQLINTKQIKRTVKRVEKVWSLDNISLRL